MSTSKPGQPGHPGGGSHANPYARFIPREELGAFAVWNPETFEQPQTANAPEEGGVRKPTLAERAAAEVLSLPVCPYLAPADREAVIAAMLRHGAGPSD